MELTKKEIKETTLECFDILLVPGGYYRWFKREDKESGDMSSKLEKNIMNYVIAPGTDLLKTGIIGIVGYYICELIK
jgi:hypothetical protein